VEDILLRCEDSEDKNGNAAGYDADDIAENDVGPCRMLEKIMLPRLLCRQHCKRHR